MKVVAIQGAKGSGKTTTAVKIIKSLKALGYTVAYLKLSPAISIDKKNSDTGRAKQAGADSIIARDNQQTFVCQSNQTDLQEILTKIHADFLIGENLTTKFDYRIFCAKQESELDAADLQLTDCICGIYANCYLKYKNLPVYNANTEIEKIANLLTNHPIKEDL